MRIVIKGGMRGESCEDVVYAIVYGMRVIFDPIRNTYNNAQEGSREGLDPERIALLYKGAANTLPLSGVEA